jgi:ABC-type arginine/histidine transport system permease subunit
VLSIALTVSRPVPLGQSEADRSLGMSHAVAWRYVIVPCARSSHRCSISRYPTQHPGLQVRLGLAQLA